MGYSQSWVSNVLRRRQALTVDQVREISRRIGVPVHLLRFGDPGGEEPTKRRDFGKAMALALVPLPTRSAVDETTAPILTAITGAQRRLDATTSARELARGVVAHVEMTNRLLARADKTPYVSEVAAVASEAAGFAAWLHADMYDIGTARAYHSITPSSPDTALWSPSALPARPTRWPRSPSPCQPRNPPPSSAPSSCSK